MGGLLYCRYHSLFYGRSCIFLSPETNEFPGMYMNGTGLCLSSFVRKRVDAGRHTAIDIKTRLMVPAYGRQQSTIGMMEFVVRLS